VCVANGPAGIPDHALFSNGGRVVNTSPAWAAPKLSDIIFGTVTARQAPSVVLRPVLDSGYCWAMSGANGWLEVRLPYEVRLQSFTLDHVPQAVATDPERRSAPRGVSVEALDADGNWVEVAKYEYNLDAPSHVQSFAVASVRPRPRHRQVFCDRAADGSPWVLASIAPRRGECAGGPRRGRRRHAECAVARPLQPRPPRLHVHLPLPRARRAQGGIAVRGPASRTLWPPSAA